MSPTIVQYGPYRILAYTFIHHIAAVAAAIVIGLELERLKLRLPAAPRWLRWVPAEWRETPYFEALLLGISFYFIGNLGADTLSATVLTLKHELATGFDLDEALTLFKGYFNTKMWLGGFLATIPFWFLWARRWRVSTLAFCDTVTLGCAMALVFGKLACWVQGCCFGLPTDLPWGIALDSMNSLHVYPRGTRLHPSQAYEMFYALAVFVYVWKKRVAKPYEGANFVRFLMLMGVGRFVTEFVRADTPRGVPFDWLSVSQLISLGIAVAALWLHLKIARGLRPSLQR